MYVQSEDGAGDARQMKKEWSGSSEWFVLHPILSAQYVHITLIMLI